MILEIDGPDHVGKSMLASTLATCCRLDDRFKSLENFKKSDEMENFDWWFGKESPVEVIKRCYFERRVGAEQTSLAICERGAITVSAMISAHKKIRGEFVSRNQHLETLKTLLRPSKKADNPSVYIRPRSGLDWIDESTLHTPEQKFLYKTYQVEFRNFIEESVASENPLVFDERSMPVIRWQSIVLERLGLGKFSVPIRRSSNFPLIIFIGGPSESGKSRLGRFIAKTNRNSLRQKIGFFSEPVSCDPMETALEILRYVWWHQEASILTFESLYSSRLSNILKVIFGERVKQIYVDAPKKTRIIRHSRENQISVEQSESSLLKKDQIKYGKGMKESVKDADLILDSVSEKCYETVAEKIKYWNHVSGENY